MITPRCDVCLNPLSGLEPSVRRHRKCGDAYMQDFTTINAEAVRLGIDKEHDDAYREREADRKSRGRSKTTGRSPCTDGVQVNLRLSREEWEAAKARAAASGFASVQAWLRSLMESPPRDPP